MNYFAQAILASTMVTNLDTGEVIPLSAAEEKIPQGHGWSPLSEHLIQRTAEALVNGAGGVLCDVVCGVGRGNVTRRMIIYLIRGKDGERLS